MREFGIDVSRHNGKFDFPRAMKEGVRFAVLKGGGADDGYYVDGRFVSNYETCVSLGLPVGVYWFSAAKTEDEARKEARWFFDRCLKDRVFDLPVYIDVEDRRMLSLGKEKLTNVIAAWCEELENNGFFVGIYSSLSVFRSSVVDERLLSYTHWVAQWYDECTYAHPEVLGLWQFGGETNVIRTNKVAGKLCDQDYMYIDFPKRIRSAGLNGFPKRKLTVYEVAQEVIRGDWGNGDERKLRLKAAGYDPAEVQREVNRLLYG